MNEGVFYEQTYPGTDTNIRFEECTETFGTVRLQYHPEGISLWIGGELRWKSSRDPKLWSVKP